jgi:hypothetical protein
LLAEAAIPYRFVTLPADEGPAVGADDFWEDAAGMADALACSMVGETRDMIVKRAKSRELVEV